MYAVGVPFTPELAQAIEAHLDAVEDAVEPWRSTQSYFNFSERPVDSESFYTGTTYDRLREIRERFDPTGLFQANQRIEPAGSEW